MLERTPGFTIDGGTTLRGFGGTAGNVLIDGQRPTLKSGGIEDVLQRISATQVARIVLIQGGRAGEAQGQTLIANVILNDDAGSSGLASVMASHYYGFAPSGIIAGQSARRADGAAPSPSIDLGPVDALRRVAAGQGLRLQPPGAPYVGADELVLLRWLAGAQRMQPTGSRPSDLQLSRAVQRCAWMLNGMGLRLSLATLYATTLHEAGGARAAL